MARHRWNCPGRRSLLAARRAQDCPRADAAQATTTTSRQSTNLQLPAKDEPQLTKIGRKTARQAGGLSAGQSVNAVFGLLRGGSAVGWHVPELQAKGVAGPHPRPSPEAQSVPPFIRIARTNLTLLRGGRAAGREPRDVQQLFKTPQMDVGTGVGIGIESNRRQTFALLAPRSSVASRPTKAMSAAGSFTAASAAR